MINDNNNPQSMPSQPTVKSTSGMGIAALVLGILSLIISWVPIINNLAFLTGFVGLVLGIFAIYSTRPGGKKSGRGISIAATVICVLAIVIVLFTQYVFGKTLDEVSKSVDKTAVTDSNGKPVGDTQDSKKPVGDTQDSESLLLRGKYLIDNVQLKKSIADFSGEPTVLLSYDITNKSDKRISLWLLTVNFAYQNKLPLDRTSYKHNEYPEGYDPQSEQKEVSPGGKVTIVAPYVPKNESDPVIVKIKDTFDTDPDSPTLIKEFSLK